MKKTFTLVLTLFLIITLTGCEKVNKNSSVTYSGKVTNLSKMYLSKGYTINLANRSFERLGDDVASMGKAYATMSFGVIVDFTSTAQYNPKATWNIKKMIVTNVRVIDTSKMGIAEDLYILKRYSAYKTDPKIDVKGTKTKYELDFDTPTTTLPQAHVMVDLNKIALYDENNSAITKATNYQPTTSQIYDELGINRDAVALKIGFRVELITVSDKTLYKDFEVVMPPVGIDIAGSQFSFPYLQTDVSKMEPFLEIE